MFTGDLHGINHWGDVLDLAVEYEFVRKMGAFYSYGDQRLGQGRTAAMTFLRENPIGPEIEAKIRDAAGALKRGPSAAVAAAVEEPDEISIDA